MTLFKANKLTASLLIAGALALSACSTEQVVGNTVDGVGGATKLAAKGVVGAGRLAVRGGRAAFGETEDE
ncbi:MULTISPECIES: hypothetical protein [unclassified Marinovum]